MRSETSAVPMNDLTAVQTAMNENMARRPAGPWHVFLSRLALLNPLTYIRRRQMSTTTDFKNKHLITPGELAGELASDFKNWHKWFYLWVVFLVQISMNFNAALYSNGIRGIAKEFNVADQAARSGAAVFLVFYAFGCELWAPWSEEIGRWPILQLSLFLVNIFQVPVALAQNFGTMMVGRALGGLSTAGGSITLGMVADMFDEEHHQSPVAFVVFASVAGSVIGPVVGGFVEEYETWRWCIWVQLILGGFVQLIHFFLVPETRSTIRMDQAARKRREEAYKQDGSRLNIWGPNEVTPFLERFSWKEVGLTWARPFKMLISEAIVLWLSLLSGFADATIFVFIQSFGLVYQQWHFNAIGIGLAFLSFLIAYFIGWMSFIPAIKRNKRIRQANPTCERAQFESRLWWLLYLAPCLCIGYLGFALTCAPPVHWIISLLFAGVVGVANYAIYMATIDYMVAAYGPYAASATGGNGWARDLGAGALTVPAYPFFKNLGYRNASLVLFGVSVPLVLCVYWIYFKGPAMRAKSPFAQQLEQARAEGLPVGATFIPGDGGYGSAAGSRRQSLDTRMELATLPSDSTDSGDPNTNRLSTLEAAKKGTDQGLNVQVKEMAGSSGSSSKNTKSSEEDEEHHTPATHSAPSPSIAAFAGAAVGAFVTNEYGDGIAATSSASPSSPRPAYTVRPTVRNVSDSEQ